ncbi:Hypothetical protein PHPALM_37356 [Phytophthora palmivora]|uniref:Chromo domain-containing protein n=1 Tax=Phytophthora palmivora TaxID=4796 RepID=A0A2P4WXN2_9STRA|nr:Hypothetical protein PHPALM_37356 [Phytophthora palmivora]
MHEIAAGIVSGRDAEENDVSEHLVNDIELTDYAQELAFLSDLTEIMVTALDYTGPNVQNKDLDVGQQQKLVDVLKHHEKIMISSGNALPPPAYGMLYELLKGLFRAGLITFSNSPWASPIVIVLKKNVTAIMEYAIPLVDDLLTDMEAYLWFCSLDVTSGFWAIMMTQRARKISAFVCALGHFEWLRMPPSLKNAPMIYQRKIDNALWGFVQPKGGWLQFATAMHEAEEQTKDARTVATEDCNQLSEALPRARTKFEADRESSTVMDAVSLFVNSPTGDMFGNGESSRRSSGASGRTSWEADQSDWDDHVERLVFALNTSFDATRLEIPFYLIYGWDAQNTISAMLGPKPASVPERSAYEWRRMMQRDYSYAVAFAEDLRKKAKRHRSEIQTQKWRELSDRLKSGFTEGDSVWLYIPKVQTGLSRKLAHLWHGSFRIDEVHEDFRVKLKVEGTGYRVNPWVHISRLKPRALFPKRPIVEIDVEDDDDFDAALLPEDSWTPDAGNGEYEVEKILDLRWSKRTRTSKRSREYLVKWKGYDEPEWSSGTCEVPGNASWGQPSTSLIIQMLTLDVQMTELLDCNYDKILL